MPRLVIRLLVYVLASSLLVVLFLDRHRESEAPNGASFDASSAYAPAVVTDPASSTLDVSIDASSDSSVGSDGPNTDNSTENSSNNSSSSSSSSSSRTGYNLTEPSPLPAPDTNDFLPATSAPGPDSANYPNSPRARDRRLARFWRKWSQAMQRARPRTSKILLRGTASIVKPQQRRGGEGSEGQGQGEATRRAPHDLVRNPLWQLEAIRASHGRFTQELDWNVDDEDHAAFSGRGVVMVGGGEYFGPAIVSIHMLRRAGCALPVEVFVPDEGEWEQGVCEDYLPRLGARCVVLSRLLHWEEAEGEGEGEDEDEGDGDGDGDGAGKKDKAAGFGIRHYQLKSAALLLSSFEEVLLLDSDSIPLMNPDTAIFDAEPFRSRGLVVWPDFWVTTESPQFWMVAGLSHFPEGLPETSSEAGQLVISKRTHMEPLLLATYYNVFGDGYFYPLLSQGALGQGDKETFMAAAVVLKAPFYRVRTPVAAVGRHVGSGFKSTAMVQHLPADEVEEEIAEAEAAAAEGDGEKTTKAKAKTKVAAGARPAFLHANTPKMNAGHLADEGDLEDDRHARLRLLGPRQEHVRRFGFDLEASIWDLLVETGCALAHVVREWRHRERLCERLQEHQQAVFMGNVEE